MLTTNPNATERRYCTIITASLLHSYPPTLLFHSSHTHSSSDKPSIYILLQHLTIDLRASFPSLLEQLASPSYHSTIQRLAAAFDIIASFLTFLIHAEDFSTIPISPDLLIKLRTDLSETFGLTVEFLRDRWDAAYAGAAGFEPGFEEGALKGLTWDSTISGGPERDALIVGAVRALSVWLKEDESLRGEAGGLMDVFLGLWSKGIEAGVDYRAWLVGALSGVLEEPNGRTIFVKLMGWKVVWEDLRSIYNTEPDEEELQLGIEEARILVGFVKSERFGNEGWARELAGVVVSGSREARGRRLELEVMVLSLASAVVAGTHGASGSFLRREVEGLRRVQKRMEAAASGEEEGDELVDILEDVFHELKM